MGSVLQTGQLSFEKNEKESKHSDTQCQTAELQKEMVTPGFVFL